MRELVAAALRTTAPVMRQTVLLRYRADGSLERARDADLLVRLELRYADEDVRIEDALIDRVDVSPAAVSAHRVLGRIVAHADLRCAVLEQRVQQARGPQIDLAIACSGHGP